MNVVAHEVELVVRVLVRRVHGELGKAFDTLRGDMSQAAAAENPTMANARKAALLVPAVVVAVAATAGGLIAGLRSQSENAGPRPQGGKGASR